MPSSGFPIEDFGQDEKSKPYIDVIEAHAKRAMDCGMFIEWLESFVGAYIHIKTHDKKPAHEAANIASQAGIIEWDL